MDKIIENKRGLELVTSHSSGYEISLKNFFISYRYIHYLTKFDGVI